MAPSYLQALPQLRYIHSLGHSDIAGGLHASAHGHEVWSEADEDITACSLGQTLYNRERVCTDLCTDYTDLCTQIIQICVHSLYRSWYTAYTDLGTELIQICVHRLFYSLLIIVHRTVQRLS